jgi:hypothetical protein
LIINETAATISCILPFVKILNADHTSLKIRKESLPFESCKNTTCSKKNFANSSSESHFYLVYIATGIMPAIK